MRSSIAHCKRKRAHDWHVLVCFVSLVTAELVVGLGWPTWGSSRSQGGQATAASRDLRDHSSAPRGAVLDLRRSGGEEGLSQTSLMKQAQAMSDKLTKSTGEVSCWHKAFKKLLSSCQDILKNEERKCRLAYEFTDCFLKMTGWPPPPTCPGNILVRFCTEKFDAHTHKVYLAFFVETATMCHHVQSEAFRQETTNVVNDLKQTAHWVLDMVKEVEGLSQEILNDALKQSKTLQEELTGVETLSQTLLKQEEQFNSQLKSTLGTVQAVHDYSDQIKARQVELKDLHQDMNMAMHSGMKEMERAAQQTHQHLDGIFEGHKKLAQQQVELGHSLAANIQRLIEGTLQSLDKLKESQTSAMEETRASLKNLPDGIQKAQESFDMLRTEMYDRNELLLKGSQAMLSAQEAFVTKQGSILTTLDRMFSLYDNILYESRALKMLVFYGTSLVFVHILTSAKQTNNARALLYAGLFTSMAIELCIMKAYGSDLKNQQWIQSLAYWIRAIFGSFTATVVFYFIAAYRDISRQHHELLLAMHQKLNNIANQSYNAQVTTDLHGRANYPPKASFFGEDYHANLASSRTLSSPFTATASALTQALASKIIRRVHKFLSKPIVTIKHYFFNLWEHVTLMRTGRRRGRRKQGTKTDALKVWMGYRGLDTTMLDYSDSFDDDDNDPDYECELDEQLTTKNDYNLRSICRQSSTCNFHRADTRRFR